MSALKPPLQQFGRPFYLRVGAVSFVVGTQRHTLPAYASSHARARPGGCIEAFMIKTGFYDRCGRRAASRGFTRLTRSRLRRCSVTVITAEQQLDGDTLGKRAPDPWAGR